VKRKAFSVLAALAVAGLVAVTTSTSASAQSPTLVTHSVVGHSVLRSLGQRATFALASCTSASPSTVPCTVWTTEPPNDVVRVWCLAPTPPGGVDLTVAYVADGAKAAIPNTQLVAHCKSPKTTNIKVPGAKNFQALTNAPPFTVTSCSTDVVGATCTYAGQSITKVCTLATSVNTLPVKVDAIVTLAGPAPINGQTLDLPFQCS
jgi:hypothetical protein